MNLKNKIYTIRNKQVMLDSNLAKLYEIETKVLNQAVKRNIERFPEDFMFQLTKKEYDSLRFQNGTINNLNYTYLRSQFVTLEKGRGKHKKYLPYVFTEQGVAMLAGILRSKIAIDVNIKIMRAFVQMRKFLQNNANIFQRLERTEQKLLIHDNKFEEIFNLIEEKDIKPNKGIFFEGQIFDAYKFINDLIRTAKNNIILIDNYIDDSILTLFSKTQIQTTIYTNITKQLKLDLNKYNQQYNNIQIEHFNKSHDRFLIIDEQIYHIGASLKDLGKKWFAFSKFQNSDLLNNIYK